MAQTRQKVALLRDTNVVVIPQGYTVTLPQGHEVSILQDLGGAYTVESNDGYMVRIAPEDVDALGLAEATAKAAKAMAEMAHLPLREQVWATLRTCYDPEIPANIVDLGLIYVCEVDELETGGTRVEIKMTLTAPGCGMGGILKADVESKIARLEGITDIDVQLTFDPPWTQDMMSEGARLQLGLY